MLHLHGGGGEPQAVGDPTVQDLLKAGAGGGGECCSYTWGWRLGHPEMVAGSEMIGTNRANVNQMRLESGALAGVLGEEKGAERSVPASPQPPGQRVLQTASH